MNSNHVSIFFQINKYPTFLSPSFFIPQVTGGKEHDSFNVRDYEGNVETSMQKSQKIVQKDYFPK